jgi:hypothetical protein
MKAPPFSFPAHPHEVINGTSIAFLDLVKNSGWGDQPLKLPPLIDTGPPVEPKRPTTVRTLNRRFQAETGHTPMQWVTGLRVRHAQEPLERPSHGGGFELRALGVVSPDGNERPRSQIALCASVSMAVRRKLAISGRSTRPDEFVSVLLQSHTISG